MVDFSYFHHPALDRPMPYMVTRPTALGKEKKLPMIVFLHGAGERGESREKLMVHGIPRYYGKDPDYLGTEVITLSPQCPLDATWGEYPRVLMELILEVAARENADERRISITGLSMGGFGTWEMLCRYPDFFSAAVPICGGGTAWRIRTSTPVRAFHGDADSIVNVQYSILMVEALRKNGGNAELTLYPGCDHNSWDRTYEETDVIRWLIESSRP